MYNDNLSLGGCDAPTLSINYENLVFWLTIAVVAITLSLWMGFDNCQRQMFSEINQSAYCPAAEWVTEIMERV